jgi:hypothetical protein
VLLTVQYHLHPLHFPSPRYDLPLIYSVGQSITLGFYYESIKRELKRRLIYEYRCDERPKTKTEESTHLTHTGLVVELEHLKIKTRLIDEKFESVRGEC